MSTSSSSAAAASSFLAAKPLWSAGLIAACIGLSACGAQGPQAPEPAPEPVSRTNSLVLPAIGYGTTPEGLVLTVADDRCDIPKSLRTAVEDNIEEPLLYVLKDAPAHVTGVPVLKIAVTDILANAGGIYGGPKMVEIKGTLLRDGTAPTSFKSKRSKFPLIGLPRGTCGIVGLVTEGLGADVVAWLKAPVDGAVLGDR